MIRRTLAALLLLAPAAFAQPAATPEIPFDSVPDFLKLPPDLYLGEIAGVAVNKAGDVFAFQRGNTTGPAYAAAAAQLLEFGPDGHFIREIGHNLYAWSFAHSVKIDPQDNIWVADKGSDQVIKFTPEGRVAMVFGRKQEASDEDTEPLKHPKPPKPPVPGMFRQVTDITWDTAGNGYISDGYINSRVAKVAPDGTWLASFGNPGSGELEFNTPHSIAIDAQNNLYVADRGNNRIQVLDSNGKFVRFIAMNVPVPPDAHAAIGPTPGPDSFPPGAPKLMMPGSPWAVCITPGPHQYLYASDAYPGRIYKMELDGKILGVLGKAGKQLKEFGWIHQIACPSENEIFVAELLNWRIQKLELHPAP